MSQTTSGLLTVAALLAVLALVHVPLGDYMARVYSGPRHTRLELAVYRLCRVDPAAEQRWATYALSVLGFSAAGVLVLYALLRLQAALPLGGGAAAMPPEGAFSTAVSFVTNTNWQWYAGESLSGLVQTAGLGVQNVVSAAVGMAVAVALCRGLAARATGTLGSFWVDLVRGSLRVLLPLSVVGAVLLLLTGVVQNLTAATEVSTLAGGTQSVPGGLIASQEAVKQLGTNGGGYLNANSGHPFEGPTALSSLLALVMMLLIPSAMPRVYGRLVGDVRQGWAVLATMGVLWALVSGLGLWAQLSAGGAVPAALGAPVEGTEQRFGLWLSTLFGNATTLTSTGAVSSAHASWTPLGGATLLLGMMLGEVAPGGVGSGLYGLLVFSVLAVFLGGLMVGRAPTLLGKRLGQREMTVTSLALLASPTAVLAGTALAVALPAGRSSMLGDGAQGFTEVLYAFTSAGNNNGSAFAGLSSGTVFYDTALGLAMLVGRFGTIVMVLALAGYLAAQAPLGHGAQVGSPPERPAAAAPPEDPGTLATHTPLFVVLLTVTVVVVAALTYVPALALGPVSEGLL